MGAQMHGALLKREKNGKNSAFLRFCDGWGCEWYQRGERCPKEEGGSRKEENNSTTSYFLLPTSYF